MKAKIELIFDVPNAFESDSEYYNEASLQQFLWDHTLKDLEMYNLINIMNATTARDKCEDPRLALLHQAAIDSYEETLVMLRNCKYTISKVPA